MNLVSQELALANLAVLSKERRQSILLEGPPGCGKSYLAQEYSKLLGVPDFQIIQPRVGELREAIKECFNASNPVVICIENLDTGVPEASATVLKFLEEPYQNVYIVVTVRNIARIPDTIISRSHVVTVQLPKRSDIVDYSEYRGVPRSVVESGNDIWGCAVTLQDVDDIRDLTSDQLAYFKSTCSTVLSAKLPILDLVWSLQRYTDGSAAPTVLLLRYIIHKTDNKVVFQSGNRALQELEKKRISVTSILTKFVMDVKYTST